MCKDNEEQKPETIWVKKSSVARDILLNAEIERVTTDRQSFLAEEAEKTMNDVTEPWEPRFNVIKISTEIGSKAYASLKQAHHIH